MAVRPPQDEDSGPDVVEFGIAALAARLDESNAEFPATSRELVSALDDPQIPYDASGSTVALDEVLASHPEDRFESQSELLDQLHPIFEEYRASASNGLLAQLRALLPL